MFLDPATILFYTLCVGAFAAGVYLVGWVYPSCYVDRKFETRIPPTLFLLAPLILAVTAAALTGFYLIEHYPIIMLSLLAQQGQDVKDTVAFEVSGHLALIPLVLIGVTWWAFGNYSYLGFQGWRKRLVTFSLVVAVISVVAFSTLTLNRSLLMLAVCGLAILYVIPRTAHKQIGLGFVFRSGVTIAVCIFLLFLGFSFLRGTASWDDQVYAFLGYTVASYNRLAAVVNGDLHYPFAGRGIYLSGFVAHSHILPFSSLMNSPDPLDVWTSEFDAVSRAGLDSRLIWSGAFGYIFSDLGWFSVPFVFGYGMLYGVVWNWMKQGKVLGIVLYPCFGFCTLFWIGSNYLLDQPLEVLSVVAIVLSIYEFLLVKRPGKSMRLVNALNRP